MKLNLLLISLVVLPLFATPLHARGGGGGGGGHGHGHGRAVVVVPRAVPRANPFALFGTNRTFFVTRSSTVNRGLVPPLVGPSLNQTRQRVTALTVVNTGNGVFVRQHGASRGASVLVNTGNGNFEAQTTSSSSGFFRFSNGSMAAVGDNAGSMKSKVISFE
jgi:hypothetical protein